MPRLAVPTLLGARRDFRLLFLASLGSSIGTWLAFVALVVDVYDRTGSAAWVSALLVAEFAPLVVVGLLAGPLLDRLPRRRVLIATDVIRVGVFAVLPFANTPLQIILLALVAGAATSLFRPALYAGLPSLVDGDTELPRANGLLQMSENVTLAVGPLLGGVLVAWTGPGPAYVLNAASFALSALLIVRIRRSLEEKPEPSEGHWRDLVAGLSLVSRSTALRTVVVVWSLVMLGSGAIGVAEVVLAKDVFEAGDAGYGLMLSAMGLGLVVGCYLGASRLEEQGAGRVYGTAIVLMAVGIGGAAAAPNVWVAAVLLVLSGVGNGAALVCNAVLIQRGVPDRLRGRAFTVAMSLSYAALGVGMIGGGPLTDALGPRAVWGIAAGVLALAAPVAFILSRAGSGEGVPGEPSAVSTGTRS